VGTALLNPNGGALALGQPYGGSGHGVAIVLELTSS
jgi:acetyl-CoA acetyltransferase